MAKDAITMFKEAAAQLQREEAYLALEGTRKKNDEDEALQQLIGDFNLARIDLNTASFPKARTRTRIRSTN